MRVTLCLAVSVLWATSLHAQPGPIEVATTAPGTPTITVPPSDESSTPRADAERESAGAPSAPASVLPQLAENKLRDKFDAFDYTDELPPNLGFGAFEQSLENRFFGTYVFYSKLTDEQRQQVYESYRRDRHISAIRTSTLDLLH